MTYRKSLIGGLLIALSAAQTMTKAADNAAWQRSEHSATADIRFKKPGIATAGAPAPEAGKPNSGLLPAPAEAISFAKSSAKDEIPRAALATNSAAKQPAPLSALLAPAIQQLPASSPPPAQNAAAPKQPIASQAVPQIFSTAPLHLPAPQIATPTIAATQPQQQPEHPTHALLEATAPSGQSSHAIQQATAEKAIGKDVRFTDDQLQLVARLLNQNDVNGADEEEPLPGAPNADPFRAGANSADDDRKAGGPEQPYDEAYYGECCPTHPPLFWVAGVEATFLSPDLNSDGASWTVADVLEDREEVYTTEDIDSVYLSPRIWIGVQGCAWGANLRYWHLNASESAFDPSLGRDGTWDGFDCGKPNVGFFSMSRLEAYTIDLEITRRFCLHDCWMQGSVGVRHAEIEHADSITGTAISTDANLFGYAESDRYTRGTGLVFGWYGRKPLFPCSCVNWYYNLRWSALWGPTRTAVETGATVLATGANAGSVNGAYTCVDDNLFIGEVQLGLEWNYALQCVPANAFFRAGVEYQRWSGGMGYSEAGSFAGIEVNNTFEQVGSTFASAAAPELDLIGLTLGTGLTW